MKCMFLSALCVASGHLLCIFQAALIRLECPLQVRKVKTPVLEKAADKLRKDASFKELRAGADAFRQQNPWVEDSALFYALSHHRKELVGKAWWEWPEPVRSALVQALLGMFCTCSHIH